ncbi:hypothetical protein [Ruegeria sp. HKCCC2117]|uniref:hypothetical protein n=1 Tax=Ruegeria sp. HKCCC2117 TaxID=2682992 RepID=UPI001C2B7D54|nr:hypothetical protein [Ruegeria sp. HKCCC2117]
MSKRHRRRMIEKQKSWEEFEAKLTRMPKLPKVEPTNVLEIRDKRLARELQAKLDATTKADDLLARFSPEILAAKYEAETSREARRAAVKADLDMAEGAIACAEQTAQRLEESLQADRKEDALRKADARIAAWQADMMSKIGQSERHMQSIEAAHEVAQRKRFNPLAEMDALMSPEPKSIGGYMKSTGEFRF